MPSPFVMPNTPHTDPRADSREEAFFPSGLRLRSHASRRESFLVTGKRPLSIPRILRAVTHEDAGMPLSPPAGGFPRIQTSSRVGSKESEAVAVVFPARRSAAASIDSTNIENVTTTVPMSGCTTSG